MKEPAAREGWIEAHKWTIGFNKGDVSKVLVVEHDRTLSNGFKFMTFRFNKDIGLVIE